MKNSQLISKLNAVVTAIAFMFSPVITRGYSGLTCDSGAYNGFGWYSSDCKTAVINGYYGSGGSVTIPASVISPQRTYIVAGIDDSAFIGNIDVTSVIVPDSVTYIGKDAFNSCSSLTNITIPNSVTSVGDYAFNSCSSLRSITIPTSVINIGDYAFAATDLTSITLPDSVTNIGEYAFIECTGLTNAIIGDGVTSIGDSAFSGCSGLKNVTIPSSVTVTGDAVFLDCSGLTNVTIPNSVTIIGDEAFYGCSGLTNVTIPNSVASIGSGAFAGCNLTSLTIPNNVTSIGISAFLDCISLTNVIIGDSVTNMGEYAISGCDNLNHVCFECNEPTDGGSIFGSDSKLSVINYASGTRGWGSTYDGIPTTSCAECQPSVKSITALRITPDQANIHSTDGIDDPIVPLANTNVLAGATHLLGKGVVADEVTPVLFRIVGTPGTFTISIANTVLTYTNGSFNSRLYVLTGTGWQNTTNLTLTQSSSGSLATNYVYLQGLRWMDFVGTATEITATVTVVPVGFPNLDYSISFSVRPTPVVLIHGIADDKTTWSSDFLSAFGNNWPSNFVIPLNYGVGYPGDKNNWPNTVESLTFLAGTLEYSLENQFEDILKPDWAFTRYDVVGHSQGGVLARMLCQTYPPFDQPPFGVQGLTQLIVSPQNFYRGRFRRVVTIGSPHNGSLLSYYTMQYLKLPVFECPQLALLRNALPTKSFAKFNPFGEQIAEVDSSSRQVDPRIRFNCIKTAIDGGGPPLGLTDPMCYSAIGLSFAYGLSGQTRGQILLPRGSDGVVDFASEGGGSGTKATVLPGDISHMEIAPFQIMPYGSPPPGQSVWSPVNVYINVFDISPGYTQTHLSDVGISVAKLLNGSTNAFGAFVLPMQLTQSMQAQYDALVPPDSISYATIAWWSGGMKDTKSFMPAASPRTTASYFCQIITNFPIVGDVLWSVWVCNTNGISTNGVVFQASTNDQSIVKITVDDSVVGDVVLSAIYATTNNGVVSAGPFLVVSRPQGLLSGITLALPSESIARGQYAHIQIVGHYNNGASSLLFVAPGQAVYSSTNPRIASVDTNGMVSMNGSGSATINVLYEGFSAQCIVSNSAPSIVQNPISQTTGAGSNVLFTVLASSDDVLSYQWQKNGFTLSTTGRIAGAASSILAITNLAISDGGFYDVVVANGSGSVTSSVANLTIREFVPPTCSIASPTNNTAFSNSLVTVIGKASDNECVSNVFYELNNSGWLSAWSTNAWTNWNSTVSLQAGTNHLKAYAIDLYGNVSTTNSISFEYVVSGILSVRTNGYGSISPNYNGGWLQIGKLYSMTAKAGAGCVFSNWCISTNWQGGVTTNNATVQFIMISNLTMQANMLDITKPTLSITSPSANQRMTNALASVAGTASDNWKVAGVWYQLNGAAWNLAPTTNNWTNWNTMLTLIAGTNTIKTYAMDLGGNYSTTSSVSIFSTNTFKLILSLGSSRPLSTNGLTFSLQVSSNLTGHIQYSTNLINWLNLTNFKASSSALNFHDAATTNSSRRFYRAVIP